MGMKPLKCPSCNANIELDDSREYGFCSYCGTKVQINEQINVNVVHTQGAESPGLLWQKAQHCLDTATIDNDNVTEALSYGQMAIEGSPTVNRPASIDKLVMMYTACIDRLGREMVATIKTYNNTERNSIAIRQTHNVLKTMFIAPNYFQGCSLMAVEELENTSVRVCRSLTGWAKNAAKAFNGNQAYCASIQKMASDMRNTMPTTGYTSRNKPAKTGKKKWWIWPIIIVGAAVIIALVVRFSGLLPNNWTNSSQKTASNTNNNSKEKPTEEESKITFGSSFEFDGLKITFGSDWKFVKIDNQFSELNRHRVIEIPVTIKNISDENNKLNIFFYKLFNPKGQELENVSAFFDDDIFNAGTLRPGASYTTNFHLLHDVYGTYTITFHNSSETVDAEFKIDKKSDESSEKPKENKKQEEKPVNTEAPEGYTYDGEYDGMTIFLSDSGLKSNTITDSGKGIYKQKVVIWPVMIRNDSNETKWVGGIQYRILNDMDEDVSGAAEYFDDSIRYAGEVLPGEYYETSFCFYIDQPGTFCLYYGDESGNEHYISYDN